ncbi:MAG TPA: hypothetical protein PKA03_02090 [Tabrizicola sp.]|nr:hypothetical protein [Tabrizicola sp.]
MEGLLRTLATVKNWILQLTEAGFVLVLFIILVYILLGAASGVFVIGVASNILLLVNALTPQALVACAIVLALVYLVRRKG